MLPVFHRVAAILLAAGTLGFGASAAHAQSIPRHASHGIMGVRPASTTSTRPASAVLTGIQAPATVYRVHCDDGTRIRATPYGTTIGLCYWSHSVTADDGNIRVTSDGFVWDWTTDWTTGVSGWVRADHIWTP